MKGFLIVLTLSVVAAVDVYAGPIPVNLATAGPGGATILNKNLSTQGYLPCNSQNGCSNTNAATQNPPSGLPTSFSNVLFNSAQVPFDIASGGANDNSANNVWAPGSAAGAVSKTIDVGNYSGISNTSGIDDVDKIWTMLNDWYATAGTQGIVLTLNGFQNNGITPITETIDLTAGVDYRSIASSGVTNNPTPCDVANIGTATLGSNCSGDSSETAQSMGIDGSYNATNVSEGVSIKVFNNAFTTTDLLANNYWLDAQAITLGSSFLNGWLNSITITSNDGVTGLAEKSILSAVTVDSTLAATPEPGTVTLLLVGLSLVGFFKLRRMRKA
jgi:hypothetical protein